MGIDLKSRRPALAAVLLLALAACGTKDPVIGADPVFDVTDDYDMIVRCYANYMTLGENAGKLDHPATDIIQAEMNREKLRFRPIADVAIRATSFNDFRNAWAGYGNDWAKRINARTLHALEMDVFNRQVKETRACEAQARIWERTLPPPPPPLPKVPGMPELDILQTPDPGQLLR